MSKYHYQIEQLKKCLPIDIYKAAVKVRSTSGETNWMEFNAECMTALRLFYRQNRKKLNASAEKAIKKVQCDNCGGVVNKATGKIEHHPAC